jgi:acetylornithine deacetylase/succinyl-diaminopimelate desuccinylase-like protein
MMREIVEISSPPGQEQGVSEYLAEKFRALGLRVLTQEVEPGRSNVIGTLAGAGRGKSLMITGHMDTTPGIFERILVEDDWLFGPGATNMKCCFTAAYAAAKMLLQAGVRLKGDLLIAAVVGEIECGAVQDSRQMYSGPAYRGAGMGTEFMLRHGVVADMAIIGEPTGLRVQCGNEGYIYAKITTFGKVIHTQAKHSGVNALEKMMKVMQAIQAWEPEYQRLYQHPTMQPQINMGALTCGRPYAPNLTAGTADLFVHFTTIPGTNPVQFKRQLEEVVAAAGAGDPQFKAEVCLYLIRLGYELPGDPEIAQLVHRAHQAVFGKLSDPIEPTRYSVSSDGPFFLEYGIPAITYGPGGITRSGAYLTRDEVVGQEPLNFENLANCARVYALAALETCEVEA